jgi:AraC-like DNA-binding protein
MKKAPSGVKKIRVMPNVLDVYLHPFQGDISSCPQHMHPDEYEWFYCCEGGGIQAVGQWRQRVEVGDFLLIPPGQPHVFCASESGCRTAVLMQSVLYCLGDTSAASEASFLMEHLTRFVEKNGYLLPLSEADSRFCGEILHRIMDLQRKPAFGNALRINSLLGSLLEIGFHLPEPPRGPVASDTGDPERRISELLFYLDSMYVRPVTVEEALRITGMSRSAFHVHFQEATGLTFCQYLNDLRLATAEHLISEGVPPDEAAKRSGFTSRSNYYQQRRNRRREEP